MVWYDNDGTVLGTVIEGWGLNLAYDGFQSFTVFHLRPRAKMFWKLMTREQV